MELNKFGLAWLAITYNCNNKCRWCYASSNEYPLIRGRVLEYHRQEGILDLMYELKIPRVILIGGEPTLYPGIDTFIEKITAKGINAGMVSNGRKFKDKGFSHSLKQAGLNSATFSIEGSCSEIHDYTSQTSGSFYEAQRGLDNAIAEGIKMSTNTVISSLNINDLEKTVDTFKGFGLEVMSFNVSGICISNDGNNQYIINPKDAVKAFEKVYIYAKSQGVKTRLVTPMPLCNFSAEILPELKKDRAIGTTPCQLSHGKNFVIDYNGDIVPCTHLTGYPLFNIFHGEEVMNRADFITQINSTDSTAFRKRMSRYASAKCSDCKEYCSGGCPLFWIKYNPDLELNGNK